MERIRVRSKYSLSNLLIGLIVFLLLVVINVISLFLFNLGLLDFLIILIASIGMYLILLLILSLTNYKIRIVSNKNAKSKNDIIDAIVKEVSKRDEKAENFIGSMETKIYHHSNCKIAQNIKPEVRLVNTGEKFFINRKFKRCKICFKSK